MVAVSQSVDSESTALDSDSIVLGGESIAADSESVVINSEEIINTDGILDTSEMFTERDLVLEEEDSVPARWVAQAECSQEKCNN